MAEQNVWKPGMWKCSCGKPLGPGPLPGEHWSGYDPFICDECNERRHYPEKYQSEQ